MNEYLHVPGVSRQEFNKAKSRRREAWDGSNALRCVALRYVACIRVLSVPLGSDDDDSLTPRLVPPRAGPLTSHPPFTTPVNSGRNHRVRSCKMLSGSHCRFPPLMRPLCLLGWWEQIMLVAVIEGLITMPDTDARGTTEGRTPVRTHAYCPNKLYRGQAEPLRNGTECARFRLSIFSSF